MPVAYLPLGTLGMAWSAYASWSRWNSVKRTVCPGSGKSWRCGTSNTFMGPDRVFPDHESSFYGMDITGGRTAYLLVQQLKAASILAERTVSGLSAQYFCPAFQSGVRIVVGHGHGPSIHAFQELTEEAEEKYGLRIFTAWTYAEDEKLKYQNDHAGANETSIVMAVRPDLVDFGQVKEDESNLIGIAGRHPVRDSSAAFGNEILEYTMKTLISGIEKEYKEIKDRQN